MGKRMVASVPVTVPIRAMTLSPGSHLLIENVSWEQYEALLTELGEERLIPRINYCHNTLELMAPLPAHERPHRIIADIVKALLDSQDRDWEDFGSTTFRKTQEAGLEPDTCFYIQNAERMRACERLCEPLRRILNLSDHHGRRSHRWRSRSDKSALVLRKSFTQLQP